MDRPSHDPSLLIARTLHAGGLLSFALLLAGLLWTLALALIGGATPPSTLRDTATGALHGNVLLLHAGLLALIATPVLRVLVAFWAFAHSNDRRYMRISALVLLVVLASTLLAFVLGRLPGR